MYISQATFITPLSPQVYHILVALANQELHAYGIRQQAAIDSDHSVIMSGATAQKALKRLVAQQWVQTVPHLPGEILQYEITRLGKTHLEQEIKRLERAALAGKLALAPDTALSYRS